MVVLCVCCRLWKQPLYTKTKLCCARSVRLLVARFFIFEIVACIVWCRAHTHTHITMTAVQFCAPIQSFDFSLKLWSTKQCQSDRFLLLCFYSAFWADFFWLAKNRMTCSFDTMYWMLVLRLAWSRPWFGERAWVEPACFIFILTAVCRREAARPFTATRYACYDAW